MKIFINSRAIKGPWGGANSFLNALSDGLRRHGIKVTHNVKEKFDLALLNALVPDVDLEFVKSIYEREIPIIHRKVGYAVSGGPEINKVVNGVVWGDKLQIEFTPFIQMTIFQSYYSKNVFQSSGFKGKNVVIYNGVNEDIFNPFLKNGLLRKRKIRPFWNGNNPLRIIISSWAGAYTKGFAEYQIIDEQIGDRSDIQISFVGNKPDDIEFRNIKAHNAAPHAQLSEMLKQHHVLLQLAQKETCSNALIEGINCGLPVIYLNSGSNMEIAQNYGVEYQGNFFEAAEQIIENYQAYLNETLINPYRISFVVNKYLYLIHKVYSDFYSKR